MNIENEIFKRAKVDYNKLLKYGFKKDNNNYIYEKIFLNDSFKAIITISDKGIISGKVIDLDVNEEYLGLRVPITGEFASKVRDEYKKILLDIRKNCFIQNYFIFDQANRINNYIKEKYNDELECLWPKFPGYGVYRNKINNKWYAIIMNLDYSKLTNRSGEIEIINVKLGSEKIRELLKQNGFYKAYHMSKKDWISIVLDDTIGDNVILDLISESYNLVS